MTKSKFLNVAPMALMGTLACMMVSLAVGSPMPFIIGLLVGLAFFLPLSPRLALAIGLGAVIAAVIAGMAHAQTAPIPAPDGPMGALGVLLVNHLTEILLAVLTGIALRVAAWVKRKWGLDAEAAVRQIAANHRETLHWAIHTGLTAAAARLGVLDLANTTLAERDQVIEAAIQYAKDQGAPEAIGYFGASDSTLRDLALSKLVAVATKVTAKIDA